MNDNKAKSMRIPRRSDITYNLDVECINIIDKLSEHFEVSTSRIIEICIKHPNDFIRYVSFLAEKDRIKKESDHLDKIILGRLAQDEMYNQKEDSASDVGESKWIEEYNAMYNNRIE